MKMAIPPDHRRVPLAEWPLEDHRRWLNAFDDSDDLDAPAEGRLWRDDTRQMVESGYGRWIGWLEFTGQLDPASAPGERATSERWHAYFAFLKAQSMADYTRSHLLQSLARVLRIVAPEGDWSRISRTASRIHAAAVPTREKRPRMQPPEQILQLGLDLMQAAEQDRFRSDCDRATLYRDGLLLGFLIHRLIRLKNLAQMDFGRVRLEGDQWWVRFAEGEMKRGEEHEFLFPARLVPNLERYIERHRHRLIQGRGEADAIVQALWVSRQGTRMTPSALETQIKTRTADEFGASINPHLFRDIAATTIASDTPENVCDAAGVLHHSNLKTGEKHYIQADQRRAGRVYQDIIEQRRGGKGRGSKPRH